jgi:hypothetical protein
MGHDPDMGGVIKPMMQKDPKDFLVDFSASSL